MATDLKQRIQDDLKQAMRAQDKERLTTVRMLMAAIKQREIDERIVLDDQSVLAVIEKMIKQRQEAIKQYETGNRPELAAKEAAEIALLKVYLPEPLTDSELMAAIEQAIVEVNATSPKDIGKVMNHLKPILQGKADMSQVSTKVKSRLGS